MPPRRVFKITCSEIEYEGILKNYTVYNYMIGVVKTCIVHTSNVSTFMTHKVYLE